MAVAFAAKMFNHMVEAESHQSPTRNPRKPAASLGAKLDEPSDQKSVADDQQDKSATCQYYPVCFLGGFCLCFIVLCFRRHSEYNFPSQLRISQPERVANDGYGTQAHGRTRDD